jgi:ribokinase
MFDVVVVGSYVQDLAFNTEIFPAPGETRIGAFRTGPGGKGFNQAVACNRLDIKTLFIGAVGDDIFAKGVREFITSEGLSAELQVCADHPTGAASIVVNGDGQNLIVVALGANDHLSSDHISTFSAQISHAKYLVCQVENNIAATEAAMKIAREAGVTTILNPAPINDGLTRALVQSADILVPNETEFVFLMNTVLGHTIPNDFWLQDDASIHQFCRQSGAATVVLTLGDKGCFVSFDENSDNARNSADGPYYRIGATSVDVVDTTGAGDAFNGGLAAGLVRFPGAFRTAIEYANKVAGLSTTKPGTAPAMPTLTEIEAL